MKTRLLKTTGLLLTSSLLLLACGQEYNALENSIYFGEAQSLDSKSVTIEEQGALTSVFLSLAAPVDKQVVAEVNADPAVLNEFNRKHGTDYVLLPESYFNLEKSKCTIEAGKLSSPMIDINIKPFDAHLEVSTKYAIPLRIVSAEGAPLLEASSRIMILCDKVINTKTYFTNGGTRYQYEVQEGDDLSKDMLEFTVEFLVNCNSFAKNKHVLSITDASSKSRGNLFARFGEFDHPYDEFQFKFTHVPFYPPTLFAPKRWNHIAITSDGFTMKLYQNGKLDMVVDQPDPGVRFNWDSFLFQTGNPGALSEIRIWRTVRSRVQIESNMYAVNPTSEGLISYWKIDEGEGSVVHDYTGHGRDIVMPTGGKWVDQKFPPEN